MTDDSIKLFERTIQNLLNMPPVHQKQLARAGRRKRILRKIEMTEIDHLIAICEAVNPDNDAKTGDVWDKLSDRILDTFSSGKTMEALTSCLEELKSYREKYS